MNRTIVVPIDFSPSAENAAFYTVDYAKATGANITLLHVWNITAMNVLPGSGETLSLLLDDAESNINNLKERLLKICGGKVVIDAQVRQGYFIDQLITCCSELDNVVVIMGAQVTSKTERIIFGSKTLEAMRHISWPLIILPDGIRFKAINKIGVACDLKNAPGSVHIQELKTLLEQFRPGLHILHVTIPKHGMLSDEEKNGANWLSKELAPFNPLFFYMQNENLEEAIRNFAEKEKLDMLIVIPKKHGLFNRLLHKSHSKQMILNTHTPVMSVHE